jgi:hypothetical protein
MTARNASVTVNPFDGGDVGSFAVTDPASGNKAGVLIQGGQLFSTDGGQRGTWGAANSFGLAATPTDVLVIQGSATHTVRIRSIKLSGYSSTAGQLVFFAIRRSSANTGGTPSPRTPLLFDNGDVTNWAPTATVNTYTANPASLGTSVGTVAIRRLGFNLLTSAPDRTSIDFPEMSAKSLVLRGVSDFLCLNAAGAALPGATTVLDVTITADEDLS